MLPRFSPKPRHRSSGQARHQPAWRSDRLSFLVLSMSPKRPDGIRRQPESPTEGPNRGKYKRATRALPHPLQHLSNTLIRNCSGLADTEAFGPKRMPRKLGTMKALVVAVVLTLPVDAALGFQSDTPVVQATSLTEDQLRQAIVGKTVYLNVSGFELPIRYKANGRMTGNMGVVAATFSQGDGSRDSGRWWIDANQLCQRWTSWMDGQIHCYKISRQGTVINWLREDGVSGTARIED
jgi:hypothetical protein